jgi:tellurite resistance protein TerC
MTTDQITYLVFGIVLLLALIFDLGLLSKKGQKVTIRQALVQTFFWVSLALAFFVFMWFQKGEIIALQYLSGYLMEWSLSIDNIFIFILIFSAFSVKEQYYGRVLLIGILMAIVFRIIFITIGVALIQFEWVLYVFGAFLVYTGYKMFTTTENKEFDPHESKIYRFLKKFLPLAPHDGEGRYRIVENGRPVYTTLFVVIIMLAVTDLVFALDSIPAVMGISRDKLVIYTSNIFAVLGLRSLFFLLRSAVSKFDFLQQGIAIVLVFIGLKMLAEHWINKILDRNSQVLISLGVIVVCIAGSIFYSMFVNKKGLPPEIKEE